MQAESRIYVAGVETLIGRALVRQLKDQGYTGLLNSDEKDISFSFDSVDAYFAANRPEYVFIAAGKSGGILANQKMPAEFMIDNLMVACNIIDAAHRYGVKKLLYLASSCSYPRLAAQPMIENALLTGPLEPTNEAYAVAKLAGIKLCQAYRQQYGVDFISAIPANAFGPDDDVDLEDAHVIPALLMKIHKAKLQQLPQVEIWGTGSPQREFIFSDDLAAACLFVMKHYNEPEPINLGTGNSVAIGTLAETIRSIVGYEGTLYFNTSKPDGMPIKMLDSRKLHELGWQLQTPFETALHSTYTWLMNVLQEMQP